MIDFALDQTWRSVYKLHLSPGSHPLASVNGGWITYSREYEILQQPGADDIVVARRRWERLASELNIATGDRVLVVGAGFGFLVEAAQDAGWNVQASDDSPWIHERAGRMSWRRVGDAWSQDVAHARVPIVRAGAHRPQDFPPGRFDVVLSEYVISAFSEPDATDRLVASPEMQPFLDGCEQLAKPGGRVIHCVQVGAQPPFLPFTLEEAREFRPAHTWVSGQVSYWGIL